MPQIFGSFPAEITDTAETLTDENWTEYLTYTAGSPGPPTVTTVNVITPLQVDIVFNEPLDPTAAIDPLKYAISGTGRGTLTTNPDSVIQINSTTYRLIWNTGGQTYGVDVTITATGVTDMAGTPIGSPNSGTDAGGGLPVTLSIYELASAAP